MLVLSRKKDESIVIDGSITVKVLEIKGNTIRLGIEAPPEVGIRRGEVPPKNPDEPDSVTIVEIDLSETSDERAV